MRIGLDQVVLLAAMAGFGLYIFGLRTALTDRIVYLVLALCGTVLVLAPDLSTRVANAIGIGRGTDLLLYTFIIFSLFHWVSLASQFKKVETQLTTVVRHVAIVEASTGGAGEDETGYPNRLKS